MDQRRRRHHLRLADRVRPAGAGHVGHLATSTWATAGATPWAAPSTTPSTSGCRCLPDRHHHDPGLVPAGHHRHRRRHGHRRRRRPYYRLTARHSGKCIDVVSSSTADSAEVIQYTWNGGGNQKWRFQDAGGGYVRVVNQHSGKCLDVAGASTADGADIIQYTCGGGTNQQWQWAATRRLLPARRPPQRQVPGRRERLTADGADIQWYTCGTGTNQQFQRPAA